MQGREPGRCGILFKDITYCSTSHPVTGVLGSSHVVRPNPKQHVRIVAPYLVGRLPSTFAGFAYPPQAMGPSDSSAEVLDCRRTLRTPDPWAPLQSITTAASRRALMSLPSSPGERPPRARWNQPTNRRRKTRRRTPLKGPHPRPHPKVVPASSPRSSPRRTGFPVEPGVQRFLELAAHPLPLRQAFGPAERLGR